MSTITFYGFDTELIKIFHTIDIILENTLTLFSLPRLIGFYDCFVYIPSKFNALFFKSSQKSIWIKSCSTFWQ